MYESNVEFVESKESLEVSSYNHAIVQVNLAVLLKGLQKYDVLAELSLDIQGTEFRPDLCLYPRRGLVRPRDILRMTEMPLLAVEILSPKQGTDDILEKFEAYFGVEVLSCWLVDPAQEIVSVYRDLTRHTVYSAGEIINEKIDIHLPFAQVFE